MGVLWLWRGAGEVKVGAGNVSISGGISRRVVGIGGGNEAWGERRKRSGEATDDVGAEEGDRILGGNFFNGTIWFLGVALIRVGLLEGLSKIIVLIGGGRIEAKGDGVLSREIGVNERVEGGLGIEFSG